MEIFKGCEKTRFEKKIVTDYKKLTAVTKGFQTIGLRVVVTVGSWDMLHIGHVRYLIKAKSQGDILVVGVDTDKAVRLYKGEFRPIVPQNERVEMLTYQTPVDFVTLIDDVDENGLWQCDLIKKIQPDIFVAVDDSYPQGQLEEIQKYCGQLIVLPRQAENTSTSKMIQNTIKKHLGKMHQLVEKI